MKNVKLMLVLLSVFTMLAFTLLNRTITGTVIDVNGQPIAGVTIQVKGTSDAVTSNKNGQFSIEVKNDKAVLIITGVGFAQQEIAVGKNSTLTIVLSVTTQTLNEVVITGYNKVSKNIVTGSVSAVYSTHDNGRSVYPRPRGVDDSWRYNNNFNREGYDNIKENPFLKATDNPLSTFSIDVDGASYSNIRRFITNGQLPPDGAVRIEEMINYFTYTYPQPTDTNPFSINTEYAICPWNNSHQLVSIGLQGKKIPVENLPPANLVFLIDVSGSMQSPDKLPLVKASMKLLTDQLRPQDKVAIVVYAGNAGLVLPSTPGNESKKIKEAIESLEAGGSTAGGAGIALAYKVALENFVKSGNNRVVLCTDGDFNVGESSDDALERMIEQKRETGVFLTVLGFGTGNYQDAKMQKLADKGNGNHGYIDNLSEAKKMLTNQFGGTMFTIAKDVKLQVEFNPAVVQGYRLIGYENRMLAKEDFNDDKKDAGELGSGHTVTALYEIIPVGVNAPELKKVDSLKYQKTSTAHVEFNNASEVMTIKLRYKKPDGNNSELLTKTVSGMPLVFKSSSENLKLAASIAQFGMMLRNSEYKGSGGYHLATGILSGIVNSDKNGYRNELLQLIKQASVLKTKNNNDILTDDEISGNINTMRNRFHR